MLPMTETTPSPFPVIDKSPYNRHCERSEAIHRVVIATARNETGSNPYHTGLLRYARNDVL
jgi:hypothetical protein